MGGLEPEGELRKLSQIVPSLLPGMGPSPIQFVRESEPPPRDCGRISP